MASRETVLFDMGDLSAPKGSRPWAIAVHHKTCIALKDATTAKEFLTNWVNALRETGAYRQLPDYSGKTFTSWEAYCTARQPRGLGYAPAAIDAIIAERRSLSAMQRAETAAPLAQHGEIGGGHGRVDMVKSATKGGNSSDYLTAKLARDRPDILEQMKAGAYPSVRAAALDAGIVRRRYSIEPTFESALRFITKHLPPDVQIALVDAIIRNVRNDDRTEVCG